MTNQTILVNGEYWRKNENGLWAVCEATTEYTPEPGIEERRQYIAELDAAWQADIEADGGKTDLLADYFEMPAPRTDAVKIKYSAIRDAIAIYDDFRVCEADSIGQRF